MKAFLILEDGHVFTGTSIGSREEVIREIVCNTSMAGYLEVMTDPAYAGQTVCMTYPLIGNYGICYEDMESDQAWTDGLIVREISRVPSNFRSEDTILHFLEKHHITGITNIDTRALTRVLREHGTMNGMITVNEAYDLNSVIPRIKAYKAEALVEKTTCKAIYTLGAETKNGSSKVALMDYGVARSLGKALTERGCQVTVYPAFTPAKEVLAGKPDGIVAAGGPGDPKDCHELVKELRTLYESGLPLLAIGLGHQLLALACGGNTKKMVYGHRGGNYPVKELETGRVYISSQNHGYVVEEESMDPSVAVPAFLNVNDGTCEGLRYTNGRAFSIQFAPDAFLGVHGLGHLLTQFMDRMGGKR